MLSELPQIQTYDDVDDHSGGIIVRNVHDEMKKMNEYILYILRNVSTEQQNISSQIQNQDTAFNVNVTFGGIKMKFH